MHKITTSTRAALEEMLQNTARSAPHDFMPIYCTAAPQGTAPIGYLNPEFIPFLKASLQEEPISYLQLAHDRLTIQKAIPLALSKSLREMADRMRQEGFIPGWRNEEFAWTAKDGHEYFRLERAAFRTFGFQSMASHVNGYTKSGQLWLGRRSETKATDPGRLDNLAAGGIGADETPWVNARRELWEEAGVPRHIADQINPVGRIHMRRPIANRGFHDEQLFVYDLELPENFIPTNHDGEVSGFIQIPLSEAAARILADEFTSDAAFVTADFILRNTTPF